MAVRVLRLSRYMAVRVLGVLFANRDGILLDGIFLVTFLAGLAVSFVADQINLAACPELESLWIRFSLCVTISHDDDI